MHRLQQCSRNKFRQKVLAIYTRYSKIARLELADSPLESAQLCWANKREVEWIEKEHHIIAASKL